jgi:stearoyl-CoA desaturase (delta-9 desaturase)
MLTQHAAAWPVVGRIPRRRVVATATKRAATDTSSSWQTERLSNTSGSRAAASRAFLSLLNITPTPDDEALRAVGDVATLAQRSPFAARKLPFSDVIAHKKRAYFFGRQWVERDLGYASFFLPLHLFFVAFAPWTASGDALRCCALGFVLTGWLGIGLGFHRLFSHRSFRAARPIERALALLGAFAFEGDPGEWAKMHLNHHAHSDGINDRHSPRDGFWHSHAGWLFDSAFSNARGLDAQRAAGVAAAAMNTAGLEQQQESDADADEDEASAAVAAAPWFVRDDPEFYGWLRSSYMQLMGAQLLFFVALAAVVRDPGIFVWGYAGRLIITFHATWAVNSVAHVFGSQSFETGDDSRDNLIVALLVGGDGWHNGHHAFPRSARHGLAVSEWLDFNWLVIKALERAGLARDVIVPPPEVVERRRRKPEDKAGVEAA